MLELGRLLGSFFKDDLLVKNGFNEWLEVFQYLKRNIKERLLLLLMNILILLKGINLFLQYFKKGWDEYLKNSDVFLILSGSSISMMESEALSYKSPLFGRRTGQSLIKPLNFKQSHQFFKQKSFEDFLSIYAILGGMPAYLRI